MRPLEKIKQKIESYSKDLKVNVINENRVFTLLITGKGLLKMSTVNFITESTTEYTKDKYPYVDVMNNSDHYLCMVLTPNKKKEETKQ